MSENFDAVEPAPLVCPHCDEEFDLPEGQVEHTCQHCGRSVENMQAQFAYSRGYDAFFAGQRVYMDIPPKRRTSQAYLQHTQEVTQLYTEAYTAIQVAFQASLASSQQYKAIEIMAAISHLFMQTGLVSPVEANYWTTLMIEQVSRKELDELDQKISRPTSGIFAVLKRLNARRRRRQLVKGLARLEKKILSIEQYIAFATPPRVRNKPSGKTKTQYV
jgi:hypothetical protein